MATSKLLTGVSYFTTLAHLGGMCYKQFHNLAEDVESWCLHLKHLGNEELILTYFCNIFLRQVARWLDPTK